MARTLWDAVADDVSAILNPNEFAEPVKYFPANGTPRVINARVRREPAGEIGDEIFSPQIVLTFANVPDTGIESEKVDEGSDRILLSRRVGWAPEMFSLHVIGHNHAFIQLQVG